MADHQTVNEKTTMTDIEKNMEKPDSEMEAKGEEVAIIEDFVTGSKVKSLLTKLSSGGVEIRGLEPVPPEARTHTKYYNILTLFGGSFISILPLSIGTTPTLVFGLSLNHAIIMIITMQLLFVLPTLYILTLAPLLGMRQSVQYRYVFGKYPNALVCVIIIIEIGIFGILAAVAGGECLAAIRPGTLPVEAGISIIMVVAIFIGFFGYRCLHIVCQYIWIPNSIALFVLVGCGASGLHNRVPTTSSGAGPYLSTVAICASNMATWGTIIGDYACYMPPRAPRVRLALYCFTGLYIPFTLMMIFGAAIGASIPANETWLLAYQQGSLGGVLGEILTSRVGNFGRFVLFILGFSIVTTSARDMYSISLFAVGVVPWLRRMPRIILVLFVAGAMIGLGIAASRAFLAALTTLVSIAGYITGPAVSIFLTEWFVFRKADPASIDPKIWNSHALLPSGIPAVIATIAPWSLIITSMSTAWYVGPIARHTGDLAYELGAVTSILLYIPTRWLEIRYRGRL